MHLTRAALLSVAVILIHAGCQRAGSGPQPEVEVALVVDGVAGAPVRLRRGQTVVVAGNGHGDPDWATARGRGTDGFVTAALARYPQGELRLVWNASDPEHSLVFLDSARPGATRLSEARGVTRIELMTVRRSTRPDATR